MFKLNKKTAAWKLAFAALASAGSMGVTNPLLAQEAEPLEEVVVTGSRIRRPGLESSSPINTIGVELIELQQEVALEKVIRLMPFSIPGDGENVNNGTNGAATIDQRAPGRPLASHRTGQVQVPRRLRMARMEGWRSVDF